MTTVLMGVRFEYGSFIKMLVTAALFKILTIINVQDSSIWHSRIYFSLANANAARMQN